jgi:hypothetical protein
MALSHRKSLARLLIRNAWATSGAQGSENPSGFVGANDMVSVMPPGGLSPHVQIMENERGIDIYVQV